MSMDNKVPEIRFKGFSGAWEDSDLKSFSDSFSYGLNAAAVKFDGVNKYLRITDIDEKSRRFYYCQLTSPDADLSKSDDYLLKNGDILFARTGASVGKTYIYNEQDGKVYFAGFLIRASINHKASAQFIFQNTQTHEYGRFVAATSQRSGQPGINAKEYGEYRLFSPTEPEQIKIGDYFQKLDNLINQHQQKHDKLSNIKTAMLEKMFPKLGETIPEVRFKGFGGEWQTDMLENQLKTYSFKPYLSEPEQDGNFEVIQQGDKPIVGYANGKPFELFQKVVIFGDHTLSLYKPNKPFLVATDGVKILGTHENLNIDFFYTIILKNLPISEGYKRHFSILKEVIISFPTSSEEQTAIGNFFQKLDALINQHQQQITKLNNIKQACLSKMFA